MTIFLTSLSSIFGCSSGAEKPIEKVGHHLQKIKDIDYKYSLKKLDATITAKRIMDHVGEIKKLNKKIPDNEPIKELLTLFLEKWNSEDKILGSIKDGNQQFMSEVTAFFLRGYVKYKERWKTLFPIFKP